MTENRIKEIFISDKTPLGQYFANQAHHAARLKNSVLFVQRNTMTGLSKTTLLRSDNENEILARLNEAWPACKRIFITSLVKATTNEKISESERKKKIRNLRDLYRQDKMATPSQWVLGYNKLEALFKCENNEHYRALHSHVAQNIISEVAESFTSFFSANREFKQNPDKFTGRPKLPGYKPSDGMATLTYSSGDCKIVKSDEGNGNILVFPQGRAERRDYKPTLDIGEEFMDAGVKVGEITVKSVGNGFQIHIGYEISNPDVVEDNGRYLGVDPGLDNLITIVSNVEGLHPLVVGGQAVKSTNQYFNKKMAEIQSALPQGVYTSHAMWSLLSKREGQLKTMLGTTAHLLADYAHANDISRVVLGKNDGWMKDFKSVRRVRQSFMYVPYEDLFDAIERACSAYGIPVIRVEESYTSQASLIDEDELPRWDGTDRKYEFSGKRIKRGLYRSGRGWVLNADVNGAGNILRKWSSKAFSKIKDFRYLMNPAKVIVSRSGDLIWRGETPANLFGSRSIEN